VEVEGVGDDGPGELGDHAAMAVFLLAPMSTPAA